MSKYASWSAKTKGLTNVLACLELLVLLARHDSERVCTKVVALSLEQIGGHDFAPVAVKEGQSSRKGRDWDTPESSLSDNSPPSWLGLVNGYTKICQYVANDPTVHAPLLKKSSKSKLSISWFLTYAPVISPKNTLCSEFSTHQQPNGNNLPTLMIQPPRHIRAIPA
jgi:hypothetical protein